MGSNMDWGKSIFLVILGIVIDFSVRGILRRVVFGRNAAQSPASACQTVPRMELRSRRLLSGIFRAVAEAVFAAVVAVATSKAVAAVVPS